MNKQDRIIEKYLTHRMTVGDTFSELAKKSRILAEFFNSREKVNATVCRRFLKENCGKPCFRQIEPIITDFLNFSFNGARSSACTVKSVKALEKLSQTSERNKENISKFLFWLKEQRDYSNNTIESYRYAVEQFHEYSIELTNDTVRGYLQALKDSGLSPKTMNIRLNGINKYAEFLGVQLAVKRQKVVRTLNTENVPSEREYAILMEYVKSHSPKLYLALFTLAHTGARVSELLQFKLEDIARGDVILSGKGGKYRRFFFSKENIRIAQEYHINNKSAVYVLENRYGEPMTSRGISELMKEYGKKAGVRKEICHPHAFRHFFAKSYLKRTKDVVQLAELLGHSSIDTTRIYLQKSLSEQRRDFNKHVDW